MPEVSLKEYLKYKPATFEHKCRAHNRKRSNPSDCAAACCPCCDRFCDTLLRTFTSPRFYAFVLLVFFALYLVASVGMKVRLVEQAQEDEARGRRMVSTTTEKIVWGYPIYDGYTLSYAVTPPWYSSSTTEKPTAEEPAPKELAPEEPIGDHVTPKPRSAGEERSETEENAVLERKTRHALPAASEPNPGFFCGNSIAKCGGWFNRWLNWR